MSDLLAEFAVGTLPDSVQADVRAHLQTCDLHPEAAALRATAMGLAYAAPEREPPAALLGQIVRAAQELEPEPSPRPYAPRIEPSRRSRWRLSRLGFAAVIAVAAFGLGTAMTLLLINGDHSTATSVLVYRGGDAYLRVERMEGDAALDVTLAGLERVAPQQTYQLWVIREEKWLRVGEFNTDGDGRWSGGFEFALAADDRIALTVEPAGGSDRPSSEAIFTTPL